MARSVVALGQEDVVVRTALDWLVERDGRTHELLLDRSKAVKTRLELEVVVAVTLGNGGDNSDVVSLGADVVCRRDNRNVDV